MRIARESRSLTRNAFWLTAAKTVAFCATFLLPILLVRQLSQVEFGLYKQIFLAVNMMMTVLPLGFAMSAFYFLPREPESKRQIVFNIVWFYLFVGLLSGLLLVLWPECLAALFDSPQLTRYGRLVGLVVLLWTASSFFETVAVAHGETYFAAAFVVGSQLSRAGLLLAAGLWQGSLSALIYAALLHGVLQLGVLWAYLDSRFPRFWRCPDWAMMRSQLSYALPLGAAGLLWMVQMDLHSFVVSHRFGPEAYAIYAIGCFQLPLLGIIRESVGAVMIARVSELRKDGEVREILLLTARMMRKLSMVLLPMYAFLLVTREEFIAFLFTESYVASASLFAINLTMIPLYIVSSGYDPIARVYPEHLPFLLKVRLAMAFLLIPGLWMGTEYFGFEGAIAAVVVVSVIERGFLTFKAGRILDVSWSDLALLTDIVKTALASLAAGGAAMLIRESVRDWEPFVVLLVCGVVFAATNVLLVFLLGILTRDERIAVRKGVERAARGFARKKATALAESPGDFGP